jgi:hypothetical protein
MSHTSYQHGNNYAANNSNGAIVDSTSDKLRAESNNGLSPELRGHDPPTSVSSMAETFAVSVTTTATSTNTPSTAPTLSSSQVVDAKSTVQSHIMVVAADFASADFESADAIHENGGVSGYAERNVQPTLDYRNIGHDPSKLVTDAWNPAANAVAPPPRAQPIFYASQPRLLELNAPHPTYSAAVRGSGGGTTSYAAAGTVTGVSPPPAVLPVQLSGSSGGSTRYATGTSFVASASPPPSSQPQNDQSMAASTTSGSSTGNDKTNTVWVRYAIIFAAVVIVAAVIVGVVFVAVLFGVCGTSGCRQSSNNNVAPPVPAVNTASPIANPTMRPTTAPTLRPTLTPTTTPTFSPTDSRKRDLVDYINSITLSGRTIAQPDQKQSLNDLPPEELALYWIIQLDPLRLAPDSAANQFRIRQRYALQTFWVQLNTNPFLVQTDDECTWNFVTCTSLDLGGEIGQQNVVTRLEVRDAVRGGYLTADLGLLSSLTVADFTNIGLVGTLPESIGLWTGVTYVSVLNNKLTGSWPTSLGSWTNIQRFFFQL